MTRQVVLQSPPVNRKQPLLTNKPSPNEDKHRIGEVAGGAAAECAAICCCCPWTLLNLVVLTVCKVPTALCKKAWKKQKRRKVMKKKQKHMLQKQHQHKSGPTHSYDELEGDSDKPEIDDVVNGSTEADNLEKEMWDHFHRTGFWRSPSQFSERQPSVHNLNLTTGPASHDQTWKLRLISSGVSTNTCLNLTGPSQECQRRRNGLTSSPCVFCD